MPAPTGKLSICAAKTKTATSPASGADRSSSSRRAERIRQAATRTGRDDGRRRARSGRRGTRRGRARAAPCRLTASSLDGPCCTLFATSESRRAISRPLPRPPRRPAGRAPGRVTSGARSPSTVLLASSTIRVGVRCTAVSAARVDPHPLQPRETGADGLGDDRLDRVTVAHRDPHRVRSVLGLDLGVERAHAADDALRPSARATPAGSGRRAGRSPRRGRPARRATGRPWRPRRASGRSSRRSGTPPAGRRGRPS